MGAHCSKPEAGDEVAITVSDEAEEEAASAAGDRATQRGGEGELNLVASLLRAESDLQSKVRGQRGQGAAEEEAEEPGAGGTSGSHDGAGRGGGRGAAAARAPRRPRTPERRAPCRRTGRSA